MYSKLLSAGIYAIASTQPLHRPLADRLQVAATDFGEDEVVFSIPRSAVLNVNNALAGVSEDACKDTISKMPNWLVGSSLPPNRNIAN